jgi:hypothetical protein
MTRNQRAAAIGFGLSFRLVLPAPDGSISAFDRMQVGFSYPMPVGAPDADPAVRVSQIASEAITQVTSPVVRVSQITGEAITQHDDPTIRVSQVVVEVIKEFLGCVAVPPPPAPGACPDLTDPDPAPLFVPDDCPLLED